MIEEKHKKIFMELLDQGAFDQAILLGNELSTKNPEDAEGYNMVADAFKLKGDYVTAIKFYSISIVTNKLQPLVLLALGELSDITGYKVEADSYYCDALELAPNDPVVLFQCGFYYFHKGEIKDSEFLLNRAIELGSVEALNALLELYIFSNNKINIKKLLKTKMKGLKENNMSVAKAYYHLKEYNKAYNSIKSIDIKTRGMLWKCNYFHLKGNILEKLKRFDEAFDAFVQQNLNTQVDYSIKKEETRVKQLIELQENFFDSSVEIKADRKELISPIFILGSPRSGSSLIEKILSTNSKIVMGGELHYLYSVFNAWVEKQEDINDLAKWYRQNLSDKVDENNNKESIEWVTDKMPINWQLIAFIFKILPDAKIIYTKRNPMDVGLSIFKQNFNSFHSYATTLENIAHYLKLIESTMNYWLEKFPNNIYVAHYENIVEDFENETKNIMLFLNIEDEYDYSSFHKDESITLTASRDQVRSPLYSKAIKGYKHYESNLLALKEALDKNQMHYL